MSEARYTIGIDPGTHTGFAVYDRAFDALVECCALSFWEAFDLLARDYPPSKAEIIVEDCNLNKSVYAARDHKSTTRMREHIGYVKRETALLIEGLERKGYRVVRVRPQSAKWDADYFQRITKWRGRTNEHARDAAKLCHGVRSIRTAA